MSSNEEFLAHMKGQGYSRDKFYALKKQRGEESIVLSCRVSPLLHRALSSLIASRVIPQYENTSDFIQNALVHQLVWDLQDGNREHDAEFQKEVRNLVSSHESQRRVDQMRANEKYIENTEELIKKSIDFPDRVAFLMAEMEERAQGLPPELAVDIYDSLDRVNRRMGANNRRYG